MNKCAQFPVHFIALCLVIASLIGSSPAKASPVYLIDEPTNPTRSPGGGWEGTTLTEQTDFRTETGYISWYRGNSGSSSSLGYATSADGISWTKEATNPIEPVINGYAYFEVVEYANCYYLFANKLVTGNIYLYNVTSPLSPVLMNGGSPVYEAFSLETEQWDYEIMNCGVAIDKDGIWHMVLEGLWYDYPAEFHLGYAWSTFSELDWTSHRSENIILNYSGNPELVYIEKHDALLCIYGSMETAAGWDIRAMYANLSNDPSSIDSWTLISTEDFLIQDEDVEKVDPMSDPSILDGFSDDYGMMISYNYDQTSIHQVYFNGTVTAFFETLIGWTEPPSQPGIAWADEVALIGIALVVIYLALVRFGLGELLREGLGGR